MLNAQQTMSLPATRAPSPIAMRPPVKAASAPASRRGSFVKTKSRGAKNLPPIPCAAGDALLRRTFNATIGTAPTGRGDLTTSAAPSPFSYMVSDKYIASNKAAPSATFGTASAGRGLLEPSATYRKLLPAIPAPPLVGREAAEAQLPHSFHATFGKERTRESWRPSCDVHSYLNHESAQPFKHTFAATIAQSSRGARPSSGRPHAYLDHKNTQPKKHAFHATFGSEPRFAQACGVAHRWDARPQPLALPMQPMAAAA